MDDTPGFVNGCPLRQSLLALYRAFICGSRIHSIFCASTGSHLTGSLSSAGNLLVSFVAFISYSINTNISRWKECCQVFFVFLLGLLRYLRGFLADSEGEVAAGFFKHAAHGIGGATQTVGDGIGEIQRDELIVDIVHVGEEFLAAGKGRRCAFYPINSASILRRLRAMRAGKTLHRCAVLPEVGS